MAKDDRSGSGDAEERDDAEDATRLRPEATDDGGDATRLRGDVPADEEEPTRFRGDDEPDDEATRLRESAGSHEPTELLHEQGPDGQISQEDSGEVDVLINRPSSDAPEDDDAEDPTRFRTTPSAAAGPDDEDDEDEATVLRGTPSADEDEATQFRTPLSDDDATEINTRTEDEATQLRPHNAPSDDDSTVQARAMPADDDPTVPGGGGFGDDDATVQGAAAGGDDDDGTVRAGAGGDDDPTVPGTGGKRPAAPPPKPPPASGGEIGMGTVLKGRFVLEDKLGAGGMGGVFRAVDLVKQEARDRNPHVAVKILNENFADHPDAFIALQRESSRTQRLSHPNIASVYDFDRDGDVAYMVMELLKGDPLDKHLKQNKKGLGADEARSVIKDISSALAYAHAQGLIHSDFKPGNIFFTEEGNAKVFDFGIARAAAAGGDDVVGAKGGPVEVNEADDASGEDKTLFDAGKLGALTPAYAAIEMFEGRDPGPQDDVYALGIVAYQCFTGKHPFDRQKAPMAEAKGMVAQRPEGLTRREWRAIRHALEFRREDRTPDAQAFLDEFFGISGQAIKAALITGLGAAAVVAGLYFGGVIGPQTQIDVPEGWVELDTQISNLRSAVQEELAAPEFSADDQFVAWEGVVQRDIEQWARIASPKLEIGPFESQQAAQDLRLQAFEQAGVALRIQAPSSAGGDYHLVGGPWSGDDAEQARRDMMAELDELGIDYTVVEDSEAIASARDRTVDIYLDEFDRRLPGQDPPRVGAVVNDGGEVLRGSPNDADIEAALEAGAFWEADPEAERSIQDGLLRVRTAEDVLQRARRRFPVEDRLADLDRAAGRLTSTRSAWESALTSGQGRARDLQTAFVRAQQTFEDQQARDAEVEALYAAKRDGGAVELFYTVDEERTSTHPGVFRVFRLQCQDADRVRSAIDDFPDLTPEDQRQAVTYAADCMSGKVNNYTDEILATRDLVARAAEEEGVATGMLASIERPDPCGNIGYVGAGRSAFCIDELRAGGAAPPVVVVPGTTRGQNYAIGKFEVSIGDFNAFCAATGCERRPGPSRAPVTGVSAEQARAYTEWLSAQTGRNYRLPTAEEWRHAAAADGGGLDPNRNCYSNIRGVIRGEDLVTVGQGAPNAWGLVNHVGNAEEFARGDDGLVVVGGRHLDPLVQCTVSTVKGDDGSADPATGFRVLREIGT